MTNKALANWAVVVAQLAEWSLPIQEVRGSNLVLSKFLFRAFIYFLLYWKDENKERKEAVNDTKKLWHNYWISTLLFNSSKRQFLICDSKPVWALKPKHFHVFQTVGCVSKPIAFRSGTMHWPLSQHLINADWIFLNGHSPAFFRLFLSFQTNITMFTTNICEKCPSGVWIRTPYLQNISLHPWPLNQDSHPTALNYLPLLLKITTNCTS